jgi:hypothetical protein
MAFPRRPNSILIEKPFAPGTNCDGSLPGLEYKRALGAGRQLSQMTLATSWTGGQEIARGMAALIGIMPHASQHLEVIEIRLAVVLFQSPI